MLLFWINLRDIDILPVQSFIQRAEYKYSLEVFLFYFYNIRKYFVYFLGEFNRSFSFYAFILTMLNFKLTRLKLCLI